MKIIKFLAILMLVPSLCFGSVSRTFDGADDELVTSSSVYNPKGVASSLIVWIYCTDNTKTQYILSTTNGSIRSYSLLIFGADGTGRIQIQIADTTNNAANFLIRKSVSGTIANNTWTAVAITHTGTWSTATDAHLYKNLVEPSYLLSQNGAATEADHTGNWWVGGHPTLTTTGFWGNLSYAQVFSRVVSIPELTEFTYKPDMANNLLKAHWPVWGDGTEIDLSGNGKTGAVTGTTTSTSGPPVMFGGGLPL